jgi:hypothetical protein
LYCFSLWTVTPRNLESFNHFDQVGQRVCLHLLHRAAAMNLYCIFGNSNLGRDLLIEDEANSAEPALS